MAIGEIGPFIVHVQVHVDGEKQKELDNVTIQFQLVVERVVSANQKNPNYVEIKNVEAMASLIKVLIVVALESGKQSHQMVLN